MDTLILPSREPELPEKYAYWLALADIALARGREEQQRIKEHIRPQVERYKVIRGSKSRPRKAA